MSQIFHFVGEALCKAVGKVLGIVYIGVVEITDAALEVLAAHFDS